MLDNEEKVVTVEEKPKVEKKKKVELSPEQITSRELAHAIKVQKFLAGGEF